MARPVLRALVARLVSEGRALGHDATPDGEQEATYAVVRHLLDGKSMTAVAEALGCSRGLLYTWASSKSHPERWSAIEAARALAAHGLVDDAQALLDASNPAAIAVDRERAKMMQWRASRANRAAYGEDRAANVTLSIADLHIQALTGGLVVNVVAPHAITPLQPDTSPACETIAEAVTCSDSNEPTPARLLLPPGQSGNEATP